MSNQPQPIQEDDYSAFMQWVNSQPADAIIGKSCHAGLCAIARWYSEVTKSHVDVTIIKHFLSEEDFNNQNYHYNPFWASRIAEAMDKYAGGQIRDITQQEFITQVLPLAYKFGLSEWKG